MRCAPEVALLVALVLASACKNDGEGDSGDDAAAGSSGTGEATGSTGDPMGGDTTTAATDPAGDDAGEDTWSSLDDRPCPDDSFLTWENFGAMFFLNYCTGCHASGLPADQRQGAPIGVDFDELADVRTWDGPIWTLAADDNRSMPPLGAPPSDERILLGEWLACGAPADADLGQ